MRDFALAVAGAVLAAPHAWGDGRDGPAPCKSPFAVAEGKWKVAFANGVIEACEIGKDGKASVVEPLRTSAAQTEVKGGSFVIPVLGIAEPAL